MKKVERVGQQYLIDGVAVLEVRHSKEKGMHIFDLRLNKVTLYMIGSAEKAHKYALEKASKEASL